MLYFSVKTLRREIAKVLNSTEDARVKRMSTFESMSVFAGLLCGCG
jgi:hypothetical protein